jgi:hypothetical protein
VRPSRGVMALKLSLTAGFADPGGGCVELGADLVQAPGPVEFVRGRSSVAALVDAEVDMLQLPSRKLRGWPASSGNSTPKISRCQKYSSRVDISIGPVSAIGPRSTSRWASQSRLSSHVSSGICPAEQKNGDSLSCGIPGTVYRGSGSSCGTVGRYRSTRRCPRDTHRKGSGYAR